MRTARFHRCRRTVSQGTCAWLIGWACLTALCHCGDAQAQQLNSLGPEVRKYLRVSTPKVVLEHVRVVDGTGVPAITDRNITIVDGKIAAISAGADEPASDGTTILNLHGYSVIPGIVGMHGHLWFFARPNLQEDGKYDRPSPPSNMSFSAPRLYLANGVTTMRTAGSVAPLADVNLKESIERGIIPGPHLDVTGPYLDGPTDASPGLRPQVLTGPEDARETVAFWADHGVTSFKAYTTITRAELRAVVMEAHKRGLKVLGHLCSVTYEEAAEIGIDSLEHGFLDNTQFDPDKKPDKCTESAGDYTLEHMTAEQADHLMGTLIAHHVAMTSTLPLFASYVPSLNPTVGDQAPLRPVVLASLSADARRANLIDLKPHPNASDGPDRSRLLRRDMELERAFVAKGGLLMAGSDPVGLRGLVPGFADQREIELLVEAGFSSLQAIRIATLNGAVFLGRQDSIGSIAPGKNADLVVVKGDPAVRIGDIENVEIVFKDGAGYDTQKLIDSAQGLYGEY